MELVERYLDAVKRGLPASMQADVTEELSDDIQTRIEEREATLGHPLSLDETGAILKEIGHPVVVASRYRPHQQLIGPALFPFYVQTLKVVLAVSLSLVTIVSLVLLAPGAGVIAAFWRVWGSVWATLFTMVGIVTIIFAAVERLQPKDDYTQAWDPKTLPPVHTQRVPRATSAFELAFSLLYIWCLVHIAGIGQLTAAATAHKGAIPFALGPWWHQLIVPFIIVSIAQVMLDVILLARPDWGRLRAATMVVTHSFMGIVVAFVTTEPIFVSVAPGMSHPEAYASAATALNATVLIALRCFVAICVVVVVMKIRELIRRPQTLTSFA
jgi:hypothetical protein